MQPVQTEHSENGDGLKLSVFLKLYVEMATLKLAMLLLSQSTIEFYLLG